MAVHVSSWLGTNNRLLHWLTPDASRSRQQEHVSMVKDEPPRQDGARSVCVLLNPRSGRKRPDLRGEIAAACARLPLEVDVRVLDRRRPVSEQALAAAADGYDIVAAAGGDGTIGGVAGALAGTGQAMGVLPLGTFNYFARSLGIPEDVGPALDLLAQGQPRPVNVGRVNDLTFLNNASLGVYPAILRTRERIYGRWGRSRVAAYWSVLVALLQGHRDLAIDVEVEGRRRQIRSPLIFVMLNAYQLDELGLEGGEIIRSGRFAVFVAPARSRWGMITTAIALARRRLEPVRDFELISARSLIIDTGRPRDWLARDGERAHVPGPFHFAVERGALRLVLPAERA